MKVWRLREILIRQQLHTVNTRKRNLLHILHTICYRVLLLTIGQDTRVRA